MQETKFNRAYTPAELAHYAEYAKARARFRPVKCDRRHRWCWVKLGPPGWTSQHGGVCRGCKQTPRALLSTAARGRR